MIKPVLAQSASMRKGGEREVDLSLLNRPQPFNSVNLIKFVVQRFNTVISSTSWTQA